MPRLDITNTAVAKAKRDARPGQPAYDVIDSRAPGLLLRVGPRGCRWAWKVEFNHKTRRMDLGAVDDWTIEEARTLAIEATKLIRERRGLPDIAWLAAQRARFGKAPEPTMEVGLPQPFKPTPVQGWKPVAEYLAWTYRDAVDRYVAEVRDTRRKATADDYRKTLTHPAFAELMRFPVSRISVDTMQRIVDAVAKSGRHTSAVGMVVKQRRFFKWLARPAIREETFVKADAMVLLEKPAKSRAQPPGPGAAAPAPAKRKHFPLMPELGRLVALARSGALDPAYSTAILMLVLAAPRNHAVCSAGRADFSDCEEEPGWGVWRIPPMHRKGASDEDEREERPHALPIPPTIWEVVKARVDALDGRWLFPGFRPRRRGAPVGHMSEHTLTHQFDALPGIVAGPHDLRRALRTQGRKLLKVTPKDLSLILDHAEGRAGSVTQAHYADDEELDVKRPILERWWEMVERHAAVATATLPLPEDIRAHVSREIRRQKGRAKTGEAKAA